MEKTGPQKSILVIEDDEALNNLIRKKLIHEGYNAFGAHNGDEAVHWFKNNTCDLVLIDYLLEQEDAKKVLRKLQKENDTPLPFVIMTGNGDERVAVEMMKLGALDYLVKDVAFLELLPTIVHQVLEYIETKNNLIQSQKELEQSEHRYRLLAESTNDIIDKKNPKGEFLYLSPVCFPILGYTESELLGKCFFDFVHPEDLELIKKYYFNLKKQRCKPIAKYRFRKKTGHYVWLETNTKILTNESNHELSEFVSVSRDITEQIYTDNLIKEKEAAELANKAKTEFLANMSHEIRNPMNAIFGMTSTILKTELNDEQKKYVNSIRISSQNLMNLINDILDFSKIEAKHIEINNTDFNLKDIAEEIVFMYSNQAAEKGIALESVFDERLNANLNGDGYKLKQILINLINNAIKFTDKGYIKLTIEKAYDAPNAVGVKIKVNDSGIGIRKEDFGKLFQLFTQIDSSPSKKYAGTGLGLTIVKRLTELLSGTIDVESTFGEGTSFTIQIPFNLSKQSELSYEQLWQETKPEVNLKDLNILLAEDDGINQLYLKSFLQSFDWNVDTAYNGEQAFEKYKKGTYNVVLMDGQMPKIDGFEATRLIRKWEKESNHKYTPVIAITGYAIKGDRERFINCGMDDYVTKPINENKLVEVIKKYCS